MMRSNLSIIIVAMVKPSNSSGSAVNANETCGMAADAGGNSGTESGIHGASASHWEFFYVKFEKSPKCNGSDKRAILHGFLAIACVICTSQFYNSHPTTGAPYLH